MLCSDKEFEEARKGGGRSQAAWWKVNSWCSGRQEGAALAAGPGKFQSRQLHPASLERAPPAFLFTAAGAAGCLVDWQLLGGCFSMQPSAWVSDPCLLSQAPRGEGEAGMVRHKWLCRQILQVQSWQMPVEWWKGIQTLTVGPSVVSEFRLNSN